MSQTCPSCRKPAAAAAAFCMYCGHRLGGDLDRTTDLPTSGYEAAPELPTDDHPPERIGGYRLLKKLGAGGMGVVYEAESDDSGERVAVKLLSAKLAGSPTSVERFKQEGRLASQISHPRCVFVYGADTDAGRPFIVMELMPGSTLKDVIDTQGPLSFPQAIHRILDVIDGLIEAHRLGVIHRDVKPSNCFLTDDDRVKVGDFGLSKSLDTESEEGSLTRTGTFLGTVLFAAPEQIRGEEVGYDSDVYSVSATLYYLLCGQAPFQHVSVTAALARAISEPPKPLRALVPGIPKAVEKVVLKGLERDRGRRWATLEDLREALTGLLPERQQPARLRALVAAYMLDWLLLVVLVELPTEVLGAVLGVRQGVHIGLGTNLDPAEWLVYTLYFGVCEGVFGATVGKLLLRIRVTRVGRVGPPGFGRGVLKAAAFNALWLCVFGLGQLVWRVPLVGPPVAVVTVLLGLAGLAYQLFPRSRHRGLHDRAAGTRTVQKPRSAQRVRLIGKAGNPLDHVRPDRRALPAAVGGFLVKGAITETPTGVRVWVAEDRSLNRRILLWVRPMDSVPDMEPAPPVRPTRLRPVGSGDLFWEATAYRWQAFVAPTGAPLADTVSPDAPLTWADARVVLEQVIEEVRAADEDGTPRPTAGVDHLWAEPDGRVHLMPFPVPAAAGPNPPAETSMDLIRQTASLLLEGTPRTDDRRLAAPLPSHAAELADRLFDDPYLKPADAGRMLAETHNHPPRVTTAMRVAHVGLTLALTALPLLLLLGYTLTIPFTALVNVAQSAAQLDAVVSGLESDAVRQSWMAEPAIRSNPTVVAALAPDRLPATLSGLRQSRADTQAEYDRRLRGLTRPERYLYDQIGVWEGTADQYRRNPRAAAAATAFNISRAGQPVGPTPDQMAFGYFVFAVVLAGIVLLLFAGFAVAFRGGLAYWLSGIALVRRDGRPAGRWTCGFRELLLWLPAVVSLLAVAAVYLIRPEWVVARMTLSAVVAFGLLGMAVAGVRTQARGPHDRITGTYPVPR